MDTTQQYPDAPRTLDVYATTEVAIPQYPTDVQGFFIDLMKEWFSTFGATLTGIHGTELGYIRLPYTYKGVEQETKVSSDILSLADEATDVWDTSRYAYLLDTLLEVTTQVKVIDKGYEPFIWRPHQVGEGRRLAGMLLAKGLALLQHMPRTGKTGTSLFAYHLISEYVGRPLNILVSTTANGIAGRRKKKGEKPEGWVGFIGHYMDAGYTNLRIVLTTPYRLNKIDNHLPDGMEAPSMGKWDGVIVDESHKVYGTADVKDNPKWQHMRMLAMGSMVTLVTATPHAQSFNQIFRQFAISNNNPFSTRDKIFTFTEFFNKYGIPRQVIIGGGRAVPVYTESKAAILVPIIDEYRLTLYTTDIGFDDELMPTDVSHIVPLSDIESKWALGVMRGGLEIDGINKEDIEFRVEVIPMTSQHETTMLHQIEGGTLKYVDEHNFEKLKQEYEALRKPLIDANGRPLLKPNIYNWELPQDMPSKVRYIKDKWGDNDNMVIMYHFVNEGKMLRKHFKKAVILQGKANSEAIDLYMFEHLIVYSMDYSVSTYAQRRDRQVHLTKRQTEIQVHYINSKLVSKDVYESVVEKGEDFTYSQYRDKEFQNIEMMLLQGAL